jgi:hypothetical protein
MSDPLLTSFEAVIYLRLDQLGLRQPRESLRWMRRRGLVKFARVGRSVVYRQSWLDDLIDRSAVQRSSRNSAGQK